MFDGWLDGSLLFCGEGNTYSCSFFPNLVNVAQDVDEDWPLEVYGHDGVAANVTMQPGDMVRLTACFVEW